MSSNNLEESNEDYKVAFTLTEYPDKNLINDIFRHPDIYDAERKRIRKYCDIANKNKNKIKIDYVKKTKYGRYYPKDGSLISATYMWRKLRSSLFSDTEYDLDIKSCHFQLLINELRKEKFELENLQYLINNRDELFKSFLIDEDCIKQYNDDNKKDYTKKDVIKKLLTRILYGGLYENWLKEFNLSDDDVKIPKWYYEVKEDIKQGINVLIRRERYNEINIFDDIKLDILQDKKIEWDEQQIIDCKKDKRKKPKDFNINDYQVAQPRIIARYFQELESKTIDNTYNFIKKTFNIRPTAYCYDGLQYRKSDISNIDEFIDTINKNTDVVFEVKAFDDKLSDVKKYKDSVFFDADEFKMLFTSSAQQNYFNKYYFKIHSLNGMCYLNERGSLIPVKNEKSHFAKINEFWQDYQFDNKIKEYFGIGVYPNKDLCPDRIYNTWEGFDAEKFEFKEEVSIETLKYHFKVVANYDDKVYEYLLNYFAHLIKKPHIKTGVCLLIQGLQGTGKTTLVENLLKRLMGLKYVYDTDDIDSIVGKFNSAIAGKFMVVLNEATGRDTNQVVDKIKNIITRTSVNIEYKGIDPFPSIDYCNYAFTTNNIKPISITKDDRRFQILECSDKYKGNNDYFTKLFASINDDKTIYSFYKFLMERDISKFNPERDRVITEATTDLHNLNKDPIEIFLEHIHTEEYEKDSNRIKTRTLYEDFRKHMYEIGYKNVCNMPTFGKILKNYANKFQYSIIHPKNVSTIVFNWELGCLV
jgi:hypothetical protein